MELQIPTTMSSANAELARLYNVLYTDANQAFERALRDESARREYVRAVFALVEGITFAMKQCALASKNVEFTESERQLLKEHEHVLDENGRVHVRKARLKTTANTRFGLESFARTCRHSRRPNVSGDGWQAFKKALLLRDRLTHPKNAASLQVTDGELLDVTRARSWFTVTFVGLLLEDVLALNALLKNPIEDGQGELQDLLQRSPDYPTQAEP